MLKKKWEIRCEKCDSELTSLPTNEQKPQNPISIYGITKKTQEEICLTLGRSYNIPVIVLRYFNVFGPRQSITNPYIGIASIFCARAFQKQDIKIFEDGMSGRDFIYVDDVLSANLAVLNNFPGNRQIINIGSGKKRSILELAKTICDISQNEFRPTFTQEYREGDIRHCYADVSIMKSALGKKSQTDFYKGIARLIEWVQSQQ